jgi:ABC-type nickel/cobalt efflux system permease component RcnA
MDAGQFGWLEAEFLRLADSDRLGVHFEILAVLVTIGIGAAHALAPAHGKAVIAAYLIGTRGRIRGAATLDAVVAGMHSASVLVFASALYLSSRASASVAQLMPFLSVVAGVLVLAFGGGLVRYQVRFEFVRATVVAGVPSSRAPPSDHSGDSATLRAWVRSEGPAVAERSWSDEVVDNDFR